MRPVSNTIRRQLGAFANSPAIACAVDAALLSTNHHAFAIENANMRLVHRDIEASKIVHCRVSSSNDRWPILSACEEELPPITRC